jgi:hypothetical protein
MLTVRYYPTGQGWWGYTIYRAGAAVKGAELRTRTAAVADAEAVKRRLEAKYQRPDVRA